MRHRAFDLGLIEALLRDQFAVQVDIGMKVFGDQRVADAKALFQHRDRGGFVPTLRVDIGGLETEIVQVSGRLRSAMVGGKHDQCLVQTDLGIDETEQVGQGAVETQDVVFALQAGSLFR